MKTSYFLYSLFILTFFSVACSKKLDVQPQQYLTPDQIKTQADLEALLFGTYSLYQNPNGFGERLLFVPDLLASDKQVDFVGTFSNYREVQRKAIQATNSIPQNIWINEYNIILAANTVLDKIALATSEKDTIVAEAKFMRGVALFELVNLFGQPYSAGNANSNPGVPIVLQPVYAFDSTKDKPARASVAEVYAQVIADLTEAADKLPEIPEQTQSGLQVRASSFAAKAFLARVYMNMGDYTKAAAFADEVIQSGLYRMDLYDKAFNNISFSSEDIFAIAQTNQSNAGTSNNGLPTFYSAYPAGRGDAQMNADYETIFDDPADVRMSFNYNGSSIGGFDGTYTEKWAKLYKYIPVVRLAEMYLTRGEANLHLGIGTPTDDLNVVRDRSKAKRLDAVTLNDFVEERFRELAFEGDRLWTLKRLKMDIDGFPYNDKKLVLPIPQREIDVNSNLIQNPGY
ncbi:RagB/SusD family nutrient uptake outer membrane protein [Danxiaibacter flavus]|uniref:RagB/SusD family nutrient uptake outer membrane protein n=1 Tax=Danxiaibacter flavus TaxID=3049108 RepID=A0ABV3ZMK7_9BACT|nr:RagB/SusD family nutrient uptake outer membrane protein [Chitinophagaceae bacterium DXS]